MAVESSRPFYEKYRSRSRRTSSRSLHNGRCASTITRAAVVHLSGLFRLRALCPLRRACCGFFCAIITTIFARFTIRGISELRMLISSKLKFNWIKESATRGHFSTNLPPIFQLKVKTYWRNNQTRVILLEGFSELHSWRWRQLWWFDNPPGGMWFGHCLPLIFFS